MEYNFIVQAGADPAQIKLRYKGADAAELAEGKVKLTLAHGSLQEAIPASWFLEDKSPLEVAYRQVAQDAEGLTVSFTAGKQDRAFLIDPIPDLDWGTFYGGSNFDYGRDVTTYGNAVYLAGYSGSTNNIATTGVYQSSKSGSFDAFLTKFDAAGTRQWGTYYGTNHDGCATDASGSQEHQARKQGLPARVLIKKLQPVTVGMHLL